MNREIKFRVWHGYKMWDDKEAKRLLYNEACECKLTTVIFMQFTGLYDPNGKEIYEGDIITVDCRGMVFTVVVINDGWSFDYSPIDEFGKQYEIMIEGKGYDHKVLGNIYENPELLK